MRRTIFFCTLVFLIPSLALAEFVSDGNVVRDTASGLMWQKASKSDLAWGDALAYSEAISIDEYDDWRLPSRRELLSIINYAKEGSPVTVDAFGDTEEGNYWSSSSYVSPDPASYSWYAWYVDTTDGSVKPKLKSETCSVRAVRGGQNAEESDNIFIWSPTLGSTWKSGHLMPILWTAGKSKAYVEISISRDGGENFEIIAAETPNDGSYFWTVEGDLSSECMIKVEPVTDSETLYTATQSTFSIEQGATAEPKWDVNSNGDVDLADIIYGLQMLTGK